MPKGNAGSFLENSAKIDIEGIGHLLSQILGEGYRLVGPYLKDGAVVYDDIGGFEDLPEGYSDVQEPGKYRLEKNKNKALFNHVVGPQSWKKFLHPPVERIGVYDRAFNPITFETPQVEQKPFAFFGVRPCELSAIGIQDQVFLEGPYMDFEYQSNRQDLLIIGVNCTQPASTCFCTSMGTGPAMTEGFDLCLTEVVLRKDHFFLVQIGSEKGTLLLESIPSETATEEDLQAATNLLGKAERSISRKLETEDLPGVLYRNFEHPRWDETGRRCLSCGNCTMVCPTCFCTTVEEVTDLAGERAERWKKWDSCFTCDFSYIHGGNVRQSTKSRYRQWMTHKLSNWVDQFGTFGCVGCGRCLTWCPVGIDITEEAAHIRDNDLALKSKTQKGDN